MKSEIRRILITGGSGFIGTNYVEILRNNSPETALINIDIEKPKISSHNAFWRKCDILNFETLHDIFLEFRPTEVIHLAGRTDTESNRLSDYSSNTEGSANLLSCIKDCDSVARAVITSTQFVVKPGMRPITDEDFAPHTVYGESKVIMEKATRQAGLSCVWTIIRPTNIWGPWHPRYPYEFWRVLNKGLYFHPGGKSAVRSYGYVKNIVFQIEAILKSEVSLVDGKTFYIGDNQIDLIDWVDGFSLALTGNKARVLPRWFLRAVGWLGDFLAIIGLRFPITSSRFRSMTTDDIVPMYATMEAFGVPPTSLKQGIKESVMWLQQEGFIKEKDF